MLSKTENIKTKKKRKNLFSNLPTLTKESLEKKASIGLYWNKNDLKTDQSSNKDSINSRQTGITKVSNNTNIPPSKIPQRDLESLKNDNNKQISNGYQKDIKEISQQISNRYQNGYQIDIKQVSNSVDEIIGYQKIILEYFFNICSLEGTSTTYLITLDDIYQNTKIASKQSVKLAIIRLQKKGIIYREKGKKGRGGWTRFTLPNEIYQYLIIQKGIK